jgi:hypothetical protein
LVRLVVIAGFTTSPLTSPIWPYTLFASIETTFPVGVLIELPKRVFGFFNLVKLKVGFLHQIGLPLKPSV